MQEKRLDLLGLCETRLKGNGNRIIHEDGRLFYSGEEEGRHGVGIALSPILKYIVVDIQQESCRIMSVSLCLGEIKISIFQVYAPQQGRPSMEKDTFYEELQESTGTARYREHLIICGDFNGHFGTCRNGYEDVLGHYSLGQ